jgi:hypothetical protein
MWMIIISARLSDMRLHQALLAPSLSRNPLVIEADLERRSLQRALRLLCASFVQTDTITASILRTHSQCQRGTPQRSKIRCIATAEPFLFIPRLWRVVELIGIEPMT